MASQNDDGFQEILPESGKPTKHPCTMATIAMGKSGARRVSLTFRLNTAPPDVAHILMHGPRFAIAYNKGTRTIRIKADNLGRFETIDAPRGKRVVGGDKVVLLRFPLPDGIAFIGDRIAVEPDANLLQRAILIDVPVGFWPVPKPAPRTPAPPVTRRADVTADLMGDPSPSRSAFKPKV
ncbi:hypothetical protein BA190_09585 [Labrys sp. WJW]|uniref:hypothetical protein n=1 Tax=Labrys sp. WJW TaxID=1737983 RepID=UPI00083259DB|nr:hypothetical protein [Labrys sp. WJW]OCC05156.1 hypothetical protein BA190_09585 [Labrys sp. WJW]